MPRSNSVIRRYTPPTCTLEILAQSSPLSRWMGETVINQLSFKLHFDDPALLEENKVTIAGDQEQLEVLCNAVTNYVQSLLQKSADSFCVNSLESQPSATISHHSELSQNPELDYFTPISSSQTESISGLGILEATIYLESGKNLTHQLYLGSLGNQKSGPIIQLSLLQIFDLATALDEYSTDLVTLPNLKSESSVINFPSWTPIAAMIALAVGLTPVTWQFANNINQDNQQTAKNITAKPEIVPETANIKSSPSPQSPAEKLTIPNNLPSPPTNSDLIKLPNLDSSTPLSDYKISQKPLSFPNATVPSPTPISPTSIPKIPDINPPIITSTISPSVSSPLPINPPAEIEPSRIPRVIPTDLSAQNRTTVSNIVPESFTNFPKTTRGLNSEKIFSREELAKLNRENMTSTTTDSVSRRNDLVARLRNAKKASVVQRRLIAANENKLFDVPQVAQAKEILQRNWQPPTDFADTLEYSLVLSINGTIERIFPLNKAAREFVDNTGIPGIGQPFVSQNKTGQNLKLRVFLSPDGNVQVFPETP